MNYLNSGDVVVRRKCVSWIGHKGLSPLFAVVNHYAPVAYPAKDESDAEFVSALFRGRPGRVISEDEENVTVEVI